MFSFLFFCKFKRHNSVKNHSTGIQTQSTCTSLWHIHITNFGLNVCNSCWDNDHKSDFPFFLSLRGITLSKIIEPKPISNSICLFFFKTHPCVKYDDGMTEGRKNKTGLNYILQPFYGGGIKIQETLEDISHD